MFFGPLFAAWHLSHCAGTQRALSQRGHHPPTAPHRQKTKGKRIGASPWKINMEPTNHPFRKENDLPNLHDYVPCKSSGVFMFLFEAFLLKKVGTSSSISSLNHQKKFWTITFQNYNDCWFLGSILIITFGAWDCTSRDSWPRNRLGGFRFFTFCGGPAVVIILSSNEQVLKTRKMVSSLYV